MKQLGTNLLQLIELKDKDHHNITIDSFKSFTYPFLSINSKELMNPFFQINQQGQQINTLKISIKKVQEQSFLIINPYTYDISSSSINNTIQNDTKTMSDKQINDKYVNKSFIALFYTPNVKLTIKKILIDQYDLESIVHKNKTLKQYYESKNKVIVGCPSIVIETDQTGVLQFIFAEFCFLVQEKRIHIESTKYCQALKEWNEIISQDQVFINQLQSLNMAISAQFKDFRLRFLEAGQLQFSNGITRGVEQLININTRAEFEHYYQQFFINDATVYTTNLSITTWVIVSSAKDNFLMEESLKKFIFQLGQISKKKLYRVNQPQIIDVSPSESEEDIIRLIQGNQVALIAGSEGFIKRIKNSIQYLSAVQCIPMIFMELPLDDRFIPQIANRILGQMGVQQGSALWSVKEINGNLGNFKIIACVGVKVIKVDKTYSVTMVMSINRYLSKLISTFDISQDLDSSLRQCSKDLLTIFYGTHKSLPELILVMFRNDAEVKYSDEILDGLQCGIDETVDELKLQGLQATTPKVVYASLKNNSKYRGFLKHDEELFSNPNQTANLTIGTYIQVSNDKFLVALQRQKNGVPYFTQIDLIGIDQTTKDLNTQLIQLIYRLVFMNSKLSYSTYLPHALDYAEILSRQLGMWLQRSYKMDVLGEFKRNIKSAKILYI